MFKNKKSQLDKDVESIKKELEERKKNKLFHDSLNLQVGWHNPEFNLPLKGKNHLVFDGSIISIGYWTIENNNIIWLNREGVQIKCEYWKHLPEEPV